MMGRMCAADAPRWGGGHEFAQAPRAAYLQDVERAWPGAGFGLQARGKIMTGDPVVIFLCILCILCG